ncbi:GDSL-type esterase/lipase family protein [Formosa sp. 3Alg 14/1]|uniref:GDSL-type esterase/lipase family protein n=1 Tax=Formosa sp. 3Alg 14/1 TaxID=3382190 RepID=UPI0039BDC0CA
MKFFKSTIVLVCLATACMYTGFAQERTMSNNPQPTEQAVWNKVNEEAISGTSESAFEKPAWGHYTQKGDVVYAHVVDWPTDGKLIIDRNINVESAFLDYGKKRLRTRLVNGNLTIFVPEKAPSTLATVIKIQLTPTEDWAGLERYRTENEALKAPAKNENRVVFIGNSITDFWTRNHGVFFEEHPSFVNRGISGQTSGQMLLRFKSDVIELHPKVVVISAGTNDIAGNRGAISIERIATNIFSMAELARANGVKVILASVLPASSYSWSPSSDPGDKIIKLNTLIKTYANTNKMIYLDYYTPMVNEEKGLKKELGKDTVHPNADGYLIMEPLVLDAIKKAL